LIHVSQRRGARQLTAGGGGAAAVRPLARRQDGRRRHRGRRRRLLTDDKRSSCQNGPPKFKVAVIRKMNGAVCMVLWRPGRWDPPWPTSTSPSRKE